MEMSTCNRAATDMCCREKHPWRTCCAPLQSRVCVVVMNAVKSVREPDEGCTSDATAPQPLALLPEAHAPR